MEPRMPRVGRPRKQDSYANEPDLQDGEASRRIRMRLAQRRYRSKRKDTLAAAEYKATSLETTLHSTLRAFHDLQQSLLRHPPGVVPLDIAVAVSEAALDISSLLHSSGIQVQGTLACSPLSCCGDDGCLPTTFAEGPMIRSSAEFNLHAPRPLDDGDAVGAAVHLSYFPQELPAQMQVPPLGDLLNARAMGHVSPHAHKADPYYMERFSPQPGRKIEGSTATVPRLAPPELQCLRYELTRTRFATDVQELAGEWLEAADVEGYLSPSGIHLRDTSIEVVTQADSDCSLTPGLELAPPDSMIIRTTAGLPTARTQWQASGCFGFV